MTNTPLFIEVHALQTLPPSCVNRDDTGSPKSARFGGVRRARVSSQAWKKAMRDEFGSLLSEDEIGQRTKYSVDLIAEYVRELADDVDFELSQKMAEEVLKATGVKAKDGQTGYLLFISPLQAKKLAELAVDTRANGSQKPAAREAKAIMNPRERPSLNAVDIALFGRMVADAPDLNVDAAVQVAHAIGIGASETEFDYYTAMDDRSPEDNAGAGMIGTVEFLSATLYRYATVDVRHLYENLGSIRATESAVKAFLEAFARSMPTGKQNTFANRTLPAALIVQLRDTQPVSLVNAFEKPIRAFGDKSQIEIACERLVEHEKMIDDAFGTSPLKCFIVRAASGTEPLEGLDGTSTNLQETVVQTADYVSAYLRDSGYSDSNQE